MLPLAKEVMSPPATPREINKHHKIVKNGVGHLLADIFKAEHKPNKFPIRGKSYAQPE